MFYSNNTPNARDLVDVCIIVPAVNMSPAIYERLLNSIGEHESTRADWRLIVVDENHEDAHRFGSGAAFNLAAAKNAGIRQTLREYPARIIVCTDADYIIPAGLIDYIAAETGDNHIWIGRRDVEPESIECRDWARWVDMGVRAVCLGSFNAMSADNWRKVGGWDERCVGYGGEDNVLHDRIAAAGIKTVRNADFPLIHVAHGRTEREFSRANYRGDVNKAMAGSQQPNYIDSPPHVDKPETPGDGLTFAILTRDRPDLFIETVESFIDKCPEALDLVTKWTIYDHASSDEALSEIIDHFTEKAPNGGFKTFTKGRICDIAPAIPFEVVKIGDDMEYWQARDIMLADIETPFALLWEDDWETYRDGAMISDAWRIMQENPAVKVVTFRYWPAKIVADGGYSYRLHENLGHPTGPKGYQDYYASHWPDFSWNPSLHNMAAVRSALPVTPKTERGMGESYSTFGYRMAYTRMGYVKHVGVESRLGKTRKLPNVHG